MYIWSEYLESYFTKFSGLTAYQRFVFEKSSRIGCEQKMVSLQTAALQNIEVQSSEELIREPLVPPVSGICMKTFVIYAIKKRTKIKLLLSPKTSDQGRRRRGRPL